MKTRDEIVSMIAMDKLSISEHTEYLNQLLSDIKKEDNELGHIEYLVIKAKEVKETITEARERINILEWVLEK